MRARGYDRELLDQFERDVALTREADALIARVSDAFAGVTLGNGVGLSQGRVLDDYGTEQEQLSARDQDEKEHWERIPSATLCAYSSSLSFFDAEGMRFHLPAFLVAELKGEFEMGLEFDLTHLSNHSRKKFSLLNPAQRKVVRDYLRWLLKSNEADFHRAAIEKALVGFWREDEMENDG